MDLPDCPPGAEGYQDSVTEVPKKPDETSCTKAEQEFQEHLNSLKIKLEDGSTRPMVGRSGRDVSGKWIYLCYPCAAVCSGESILQTHISGKKHKCKLAMTNSWPLSIFDEHPFNQHKTGATEKVLQKMAHEVDIHNKHVSELDKKFSKLREVPCHIQESLDAVKAPLIGLEYLIEHAPEQEHYEPKYLCTLCSKQGHPRTIINHMTCFWHRYNYILRHYPKACNLLTPYRSQTKYREGVGIIINRLAQRIEDKYGRQRPIHIDKEEYDKEREMIHQWIFKAKHFAEREGCTFEEVVDIGLIDSLHKNSESKDRSSLKRKEPSPPIVAAPSKPHFNHFSRPAGRQERRGGSAESLSDISDELDAEPRAAAKPDRPSRERADRHITSPISFRSRFIPRSNAPSSKNLIDKTRAPNYEYKVKLASDKRTAAEEFARKTLAYHEKNPEKHPLYPEEWKKFWNKRYKEIQAEGKDPSKHDFKPEWIVFWTARMKALHDEELRVTVNEIYRKMCLSPPDMTRVSEPPGEPRRAHEPARRAEDLRRRSPADKRRREEPRRREPEPRRRSPELRRRSPELRRRSPDMRRRSPEVRHRSPLRRRSPDIRRDRRSPPPRRSPGRRRSPPPRHTRSRSRSRSRSPVRRHSPVRLGTRIALESVRRSRSPLSQREMQPRNRSPEQARELAPSMQTVLISDDELKPDDGLSPWNSDNEIASVTSVRSMDSRRRSAGGAGNSAAGGAAPDDVVATLRLLVALEDYLGSLGPKLVDLLAEALKMEKEKANSSEELLLRESAVVLIETAKEKLKGAAQAGLVSGSAASAARAAVVRAAATLHEADKRARKQATHQSSSSTTSKSAVPVAGVGEVDRAQIAQQMAEALIAQGKTDVSSEELAQLVEAVVGMAEAKKREAASRQPEVRPPPSQSVAATTPRPSGTASALQLLQSAYDENEKRIEKEDAPDAMDGLSDSDLETLLKNFNELSAEEQHSLIAYLKKLEAREPARVERLRQYVSDAAHAPAPASAPAAAPAPARRSDEPAAVLIESDDDDDYTVEEVFKSATQKVKEDQMRQEMEIVKKSLEESKPATPATPQPAEPPMEPVTTTDISSIVDITRNLSSASDLFALVQASIKSAPAPTPAPIVHPPEVVASSTQPRSFGDLPEPSVASQEPSKEPTSTPLIPLLPINNQPAPLLRNPPMQSIMDNRKVPSPGFNQGNQPMNQFNQPPNDRFNQGNTPPNDRFNQGNPPSNDRFNNPGAQPPADRFNQGNSGPIDRFNQGNQPPNDRFNQGNQLANDRFNAGNVPPNNRFNQVNNPPPNDRFNQVNAPPSDRYNQANTLPNDRFNQGNATPNDRFNQGNAPPNDRFNQGINPTPNDRFNQGNNPTLNDRFNQVNNPTPNDRFNQSNNPPLNDRFNQGNAPTNDRFNSGNNPSANDRFNQGNAPANDHFNQGNNPPPNDRFNQGNQQMNDRFSPANNPPPNDRFNQGNAPPTDRFNQANPPPNDRFNQANPPPNDRFNQGNQWTPRPNMPLENRVPLIRPLLGAPDNFNHGGQFNQGPRPSFMNPRGQDNFDNRQLNMNQPQFGNYDNQNNFRGRGGRGHYGGLMRGRGRGYY